MNRAVERLWDACAWVASAIVYLFFVGLCVGVGAFIAVCALTMVDMIAAVYVGPRMMVAVGIGGGFLGLIFFFWIMRLNR